MAKSTVFQFVVFHNPEEGEASIVESGFVVAVNQDKAKMIVTRKIPKAMDSKIEHIEVLVRPF
tara:strand:+ start:427 stop:615 length:189 start_codon:yes stop_codon:yes gene_type:complete